MTKKYSALLPLLMIAALGLTSCGKAADLKQGLSVKAYLSGTKLPYQSRDIKLLFNKGIDPATIPGNITLSDKTGSLNGHCTFELYAVDAADQTVRIKLNDDFKLAGSWRYTIRITRGLRATTGDTLSADTNIDLITSSRSPFATAEPAAVRTKIVVISDIHMGEERAAAAGYCWFTDNSSLLGSFLDDVAQSDQIKTLVINGDFFDEWIVPMEMAPFQPGISSDEGYFLSVANAPLNKPIIAKLNAIASGGQIKVVYVPGNHDMLLTEAILKDIIPDIEWHGTGNGIGEYWPEPSIAIEHGHRYDFFNSPDPLTRPGSLLPPGYFISRLYATKSLSGPVTEALKARALSADVEFVAGWDLAIADININNLDRNAAIIKMGINGYAGPMSVNDAQANYDQQIGSQWDQRQGINGVYSKMMEWTAILNGSGIGWWGDLEEPAEIQYLLPGRAKIVVFGHSHKALIKKDLFTSEGIYANTGTWINANLVAPGYCTRTFIVIDPAVANSSEVDTVTLYQYNGSGDLTQLAEENITNN